MRSPGRRFPPFLTPRGSVFLLASLAASAAGVHRAELASLFWGAATLFLALVSWISVAASSGRLARLLSSGRLEIDLSLPAAAAYPGAELKGRLTANRPRLLPWLETVYLLDLENREGNRFRTAVRLDPGEPEAAFTARAPRRGEYSGPSGFLAVRDRFGFAERMIRMPGETRFTVYPSPAEEAVEYGASEGGARNREKAEKRRTDEFLETRKYVPGDDTRRIDWKLYAHGDELMLRIGEESPPPEALTLMVLVTSADPGLVPRRLVPDALDRMAGVAARLVIELTERGKTVVLAAEGSREPASAEPGKIEAALACLAGMTSGNEAGSFRGLPDPASVGGTLVLAFPGSPGLRPLLRELRDRPGGSRLILVDPAAGLPEPSIRHPIERILFLPAEKSNEESWSRANREALAEALRLRAEEDRRLSSDPSWRIEHAVVV